MYPAPAKAHNCTTYQSNLANIINIYSVKNRIRRKTTKRFSFYFSKVESPCLIKYLNPCNEVLSKNCRIVTTNNFAVKKSFELLKFDAITLIFLYKQ